jgi:hypothetical protein
MPLLGLLNDDRKPKPAAEPVTPQEPPVTQQMTPAQEAEITRQIEQLEARIQALGADILGANDMSLSKEQQEVIARHAAAKEAEAAAEQRLDAIMSKKASEVDADELLFLKKQISKFLGSQS